MATVHIPDHLASVTNDQRQIDIVASTYRELIDALEARFPGAREAIMGKVAVAIDGDIIHDPFLDPLEADSQVHFLHKIEGG